MGDAMGEMEYKQADVLEAENYTRKQHLSDSNKKLVNKMEKYVKSHLSDKQDYENVRKKIIDLAELSEKENKELVSGDERSIVQFCNSLIEQETDVVISGQNYLRMIANIYLYIFGILGVVASILMLGQILIEGVPAGNEKLQLATTLVFQFVFSIIYIMAGRKGKKYSGSEEERSQLKKWTSFLLLIEILNLILILLNGVTNILSGVIHIACAVAYVRQAKLNG